MKGKRELWSMSTTINGLGMLVDSVHSEDLQSQFEASMSSSILSLKFNLWTMPFKPQLSPERTPFLC
jgi:hypothetical protein